MAQASKLNISTLIAIIGLLITLGGIVAASSKSIAVNNIEIKNLKDASRQYITRDEIKYHISNIDENIQDIKIELKELRKRK